MATLETAMGDGEGGGVEPCVRVGQVNAGVGAGGG